LPGHRSPGREQIRAHGQPRGRYSRNAWLLILSSALGSGVFLGAVQLLNPLYAVRLGYGPAEIGALSAAGAIAYSIGSPAGGALASRYGVRRVMLWGIAIAALGMALPPLAVLLPAATRLPFLIGGQLVANGGWAFKQVSLVAALAGATSPEARTGAYAVHEAASGAAALAGALLGGALPAAVALLLHSSTAAAVPYALTLAAGALVSTLALLPAARVAPEDVDPGSGRAAGSLAGPARSRRRPALDLALLLVLVCGVGTTAGQGAAKAFASVYLDTAHGVPTAQIGSFVSVGLGASVLAAIASGRIARRLSNGLMMLVGSAIIAGGLLLMALSPGVGGAVVGIVLVYGILGLWRPAYQAAQMEIAGAGSRAAISGISAMAMSIGFGSMTYGGGAIAARAGYPAVFLAGAGVSLVAAVLGGALSWRMARRAAPADEGTA